MTSKKTDNHNAAGKLALRRYFLKKYHGGGERRILDCCQGSGLLWGELLLEFPGEYLGVDLKPKRGRLKIDSQRILDQPGWEQNIIDVDTYGSPWRHWLAVLKHCEHPATIFLTCGHVASGQGGNFDHALLPVLGIRLRRLKISNALGVRLNAIATDFALAVPSAHGLAPVEALECLNPGGSARYFGIRLDFPPKNLSASA